MFGSKAFGLLRHSSGRPMALAMGLLVVGAVFKRSTVFLKSHWEALSGLQDKPFAINLADFQW